MSSGLDNNPFFAYRLSADHVIETEPIGRDLYRFVGVIRPSGNSAMAWPSSRSWVDGVARSRKYWSEHAQRGGGRFRLSVRAR